MAIWVTGETRVLIQGVTGAAGRSFASGLAHPLWRFVAGVTPGRGGETVVGRPVFDSVREAMDATGANASLVVVPAPFARDAVLEAVDAGIGLVTVYTDLMPVHDAMLCVQYARARHARLIGPNAAGIYSPGRGAVSEPQDESRPAGVIGVVGKSGSIAFETMEFLDDLGLGTSTVCCLGGDPVIGTTFLDCLEAFEADPETRGVVLLGEVGSTHELLAARFIRRMTKPVVAHVIGHAAPWRKPMGHSGAVITEPDETAEAKTRGLAEAGARVAWRFEEIPELMAKAFG